MTTLAIGKEYGGLYHLKPNSTTRQGSSRACTHKIHVSCNSHVSGVVSSNKAGSTLVTGKETKATILWHMTLSHPSSSILSHVKPNDCNLSSSYTIYVLLVNHMLLRFLISFI